MSEETRVPGIRSGAAESYGLGQGTSSPQRNHRSSQQRLNGPLIRTNDLRL